MEKYNKISSKMYTHLVQQIVQQIEQQNVQEKVQNDYVAPLIKQSVFTKFEESLY